MIGWRWVYRVRLRLRSVFLREQVERELDEEFRFHLEQRIEQEIARGLTPAQARSAALRAMDGILQKKEECRDLRRVNLVDALLQDLRYASRSLRQNPIFAAVTVLTLTLGMGATMAILTIVNSVLLRPLPFPAAGRLVALSATTETRPKDSTSFPDFHDWQQARSFSGAAAWRRDQFTLTGGGPPESVTGLRASYELLRVLGIGPAIGRSFEQREQQHKSPVALISHALWMRRFGGDAGALGQTIVLNGDDYAVIGVLPRDFRFPLTGDPAVLVPITESPDRSRGYLFAIARLQPGVRIAAAQRELDGIAARLQQAFPYSNRGRGIRAVALQDAAAGDVRVPLLILMSAAVFVMLIGCANVGNLMLARGIARRSEFALRTALGAGAARLASQLLTESAVLATAAALVGSASAVWGSGLLAGALAQRFALPVITPDWRLLAIGLTLTMVCGLLCGLPPALTAARSRIGDALREATRGASSGRTDHGFRNVLVVGEVALTFVLLAGAGLMIKSLARLEQTELGLDPRHVVTADLPLSKRYADPQRRAAFLRQILDSLGALPGIDQAALHTDPPFLGGGARETFHLENRADPGPQQGHVAAFDLVSDGYFRAMGIPLLRGRNFDQGDIATGVPVAIVNAAMAQQLWPGEDPLGKRIRLYYDRDPGHWISIVGVAADVRYYGRDLDPVPQVFIPYRQDPYRSLPYPPAPFASLVLRTAADPASLTAAIPAKIWTVDSDQPVQHLQTMEQALSDSLAGRRVCLLLLSYFAAIALAMAVAGIYGLVSYSVARRTPELGIRAALGAGTWQIAALVVREGALLTSLGIAIGVAGGLLLTRVLAALLYGITPTDPVTFVETAAFFFGVGLIAASIPAQRATRIDPAVSLRRE